MIKIENGIPFEKRPSMQKYPWADMQVGDSFFSTMKDANSLSSARALAQAQTGFKFSIRKEGKGVRIWRTA